MKFDTKSGRQRNAQIRYVVDDFSFRTEPQPEFECSFGLNELEILISGSGDIVGVSGYCPYFEWSASGLEWPAVQQGTISYLGELNANGITVKLNRTERWKALYDPACGILCICSNCRDNSTATVQILDNLAFGLDQVSELSAVWIKIEPGDIDEIIQHHIFT